MTIAVVSRVLRAAAGLGTAAGACLLTLGSASAMADPLDQTLALASVSQSLTQLPSSQEEAVAVPAAASALGEQRYHYNLAKSALYANKLADYQHYYDLLGDYPLRPYLDYTLLRSKLSELPFAAVDEFFSEYPESFLAIRLRQTWLAQLAARQKWQAYVNYYQADVATTELECHYVYARVHNGDTAALADTAKLWDIGESQPKACDPIFSEWRKAGLLTEELIWSRFDKAMQQRNRGLARYLSSLLEGETRQMAQLYLEVDGNPWLMSQHKRFREQSPAMQQVIAHGISRLARRDAELALAHWETYEAQQLFAEKLSRDTKVTLTRYLTRQGQHATAEQLLQSSAALRQTDVVEELIRESLKEMDWAAVKRRIRMLPEDEQASDRWLYWSARTVQELALDGGTDTPPQQVYERLADKRSFYGFLAADILGREYALEDVPVEVRPAAMELLESSPGMRRAKELWLTGNHAEAQAEWLYTTRKLDRNELVTAGQLARQWGWYHKGIHAMIAGNLWDHLTIRFPLAYQETVTQVALDTQLEPNLIYAIARQESAFAEDAHSPAGARGLMQLMPATAAQTAKRNGLKFNIKDLYKPEQNIMLGSSYYTSLMEKFGNNRILATAAYNAGPHRVARWISEPDQERPFDVWIETIPFRETRGYVQNVLCYSVIYGYRMGQSPYLVTAKEAEDRL